MCASCSLQDKFQTRICSVCTKTCRSTDCYQDDQNDGVTICIRCAPAHAPLKCTVCEERKHPGAFADKYRQARQDPWKVRRCKSCSERCSECQKHMADERGFEKASSLCKQCWSNKQAKRCMRCGVYKQRNCYDPNVMHHHTSDKKKLGLPGMLQARIQHCRNKRHTDVPLRRRT